MITQKLAKNELFHVNLPEQTSIFFIKNSIVVCGTKGKIISNIILENDRCFISIKKNLISLYKKEHKQQQTMKLLKFYNIIQNLLYGVHHLFSKKLLFIGVGFKIWLKISNNKTKVLLLKVGFSEDLYIPVPKNIMIFPFKYTLLLIRGLDKKRVQQFASLIKSYKKLDKYKGKGILYKDEIITLKDGKKS